VGPAAVGPAAVVKSRAKPKSILLKTNKIHTHSEWHLELSLLLRTI